MRTSYFPDFVIDDDRMIGFNFTNGGCAEHEFGIAQLKRDFGINSVHPGTARRQIHHCPVNLKFVQYSKNKIRYSALIFMDDIEDKTKREMKSLIHRLPLCHYTQEDKISAAWDDNSFAILVSGKKFESYLEMLYKAFEKKDILIYLGNPTPENPFSEAGLVFMIKSNMSVEEKEKMYEKDEDHDKLKKEADPIIKRAKNAGLRFFTLSPKWANKEKTKLAFWLNPIDQRNNFFGWVTPQDLIDWEKGTGLIPGHGFDFAKNHKKEYDELRKNHHVFE